MLVYDLPSGDSDFRLRFGMQIVDNEGAKSDKFSMLVEAKPTNTIAPIVSRIQLFEDIRIVGVYFFQDSNVAARCLVEFHVRYFNVPEYPADLTQTSTVEGIDICHVPFN